VRLAGSSSFRSALRRGGVKRYKVIFLPHAERRLGVIEAYIAERSSTAVAERFVAAVVHAALKLESFPHRGTPREDLMSGLRTIVHRRTVTIAYVVEGDEVAVTDFLYRGEDAAARFR
jgi:plasmid stabilization system protein ParE